MRDARKRSARRADELLNRRQDALQMHAADLSRRVCVYGARETSKTKRAERFISARLTLDREAARESRPGGAGASRAWWRRLTPRMKGISRGSYTVA